MVYTIYSMDQNLLHTFYITDNLSQRETAKKLGCSQSNVKYWLKKHNIAKKKKLSYDHLDPKSTKVCSSCQEEKLISLFYLRRDQKNLVPSSWCKECNTKQVVASQRKIKRQCIEYKGGSCSNCNFNAYDGALEFHHIDPSKKDMEISKIARKKFTEQVRIELDKCLLLCSNCHRMKHAGLI